MEETSKENLENLYKYASIVMDQYNKNFPKGEITKISIEDNYGTVININITKESKSSIN